MDAIGWVLIGLGAALFMWLVAIPQKKKWYKVYLANNDVLLLQRDSGARWRTSDRYMRFRDERGHEITFPSGAHWILMWEEVKDNELELVKQEIRKIKESLIAEREGR